MNATWTAPPARPAANPPTTLTLTEAINQFRDAMQTAGITPPPVIRPTGAKPLRFPTNGKPGDDAGWYVFHADGIPAGAFGDWRAGFQRTWRADIGRPLTTAEKVEYRRMVAEFTAAQRAEDAARALLAAEKARALLAAGSDPSGHPYLVRKEVEIPPGAAVQLPLDTVKAILNYWPKAKGEPLEGAILVAPFYVEGELTGAELIDGAGRKAAVAGSKKAGACWMPEPIPADAPTVMLGEGLATCLSAAQATGLPVAAALSAGNLLAVARQVRASHPNSQLIILADLEKKTGLAHPDARRAAELTGARLAAPTLDPESGTDWNDYALIYGHVTAREALLALIGDLDAATPTLAAPTTWPLPERRPVTTTDLADSDLGNCRRLFDRFGGDLLFVGGTGWHVWGGNRWRFDEPAARRRADELPQIVLREARDALDSAAKAADSTAREKSSAQGAALLKWARRCESSRTISDALSMLERRLFIGPSEADSGPFLLAAGNGTLDLKTGQLRPSERGDFITLGTAVKFDPAATCPVFEGFLRRVFRQHPDLIPFIQKAVGYSLTGDTREQCLFLLHGSGANGKSTLLSVIEGILGDYARQAAPDLLTAKTGDRHPTEIADLRGARLVSTCETGEGRRLAESLVKQMTGGDRLKGRRMHQDFFEFQPEFKLWLATNHLPQIRGTDGGIWRRIRLVPFLETITDDEKDPMLPAKLRAEAPGILAWAVRGCLEWQAGGLQPPSIVTATTADYRASEDTLGAFLAERCQLGDGLHAGASELYRAYREWAEENGEFIHTQTRFGRLLTERGIERIPGRTITYRGIGLPVYAYQNHHSP